MTARLSREQDDPGFGRRGLRLRMHLLICGYCRRYGRQLDWMRDSLRRALAHADATRLSENARERIRERLRDA